VLAEQLIYAGTSRKGQGRRAIAQTLNARGIARDIADAALEQLPDDDDDRALEYARSKAHGLRSYDLETAMRRLMGQLARRGYSGSVASNAARTALTEQRSSGGVQFR
jgi:regulatory protein